ncbi:MAG: TIGR03545 family protein [Bdellovibrionales bacterium]
MKNISPFKKYLRTEAFILVGVVGLLIALYGYFFAEFHIKRAIEKSAFEAIGAEVNIDSVDINLFKPSVKVTRIQVTNPDKPEENLLEIGNILSNFEYGPLIQGSFISDLTNVIGIEIHTDRASPGRVLPKEKRVLVLKDPGQNKVQDVLKDKFKKTAFSDVVGLLSSDKHRDIEEKYKKELEGLKLSSEVDAKVNGVKAKLKAVEEYIESDKIKSLLKEVKSFRFKSGSSSESLASVSTAVALTKRLKKERKKIKSDLKEIERESDEIKRQLKSAPSKFLADVDGVQGSLSPSQVSPEKMTENVLSEYFSVQLEQIGRATNSLKNDALGSHGKYIDLDQSKKPSPKAAADSEAEVSQVNLEKKKEEAYSKIGKDVIFYKEALPPKYWLKVINIVSKAHKGQDFGDITGRITDFSDAPQITQKEMRINIEGSVPKQDIGLFKIKANINHIDPEKRKEVVKVNVSDYVVKGASLFKGSDEWINILKANSQTDFTASLQGDDIELELKQTMKSPNYEVFSKDKNVLKLLNQIKLSKEDLTFRLKASGDITSPKISIRSNLGDIIVRAVKANLTDAVGEFAKKQLSKLDGKALEKLGPYLDDVDVTNLKAVDLSKVLDKEIAKGLKKLKSGNKSKKEELLKKLFKKF